jgi:hypothetical protein
MTVNPLFARLGIPADADTLVGIKRLVSERARETRHLTSNGSSITLTTMLMIC